MIEAAFVPKGKYIKSASVRALVQIGGILNTRIKTPVDLVRAARKGISADWRYTTGVIDQATQACRKTDWGLLSDSLYSGYKKSDEICA